jgi:hypothetical protein
LLDIILSIGIHADENPISSDTYAGAIKDISREERYNDGDIKGNYTKIIDGLWFFVLLMKRRR